MRQAMSLVCPVQKQLCQQEPSIYLQNPCKLSSGLSLVAGLIQKFFKAWKNIAFLCILFLSIELFFQRGNFPGSALCPSQTISKHLVLYSISILFPCDVLDQARVLNSPASGLHPYLSVGS